MEACAKAASDAGAGGGGRGGVPSETGGTNSSTTGRDMGGALPQLEQALSRLGGGIWGAPLEAGDVNTSGTGPLSGTGILSPSSQLLGAGGAEEWGCVEAVLDQAAADKVDPGSVAWVMCERIFFVSFFITSFPFLFFFSFLILTYYVSQVDLGSGAVVMCARLAAPPCTLHPEPWTLNSGPWTLDPEL